MNQLASDGMVITVVGMLVVFAFLTIMVWAMHLTSAVIKYLDKKFPPKAAEASAPAKKKTQTNEEELVAVAIAALMNRKNAG